MRHLLVVPVVLIASSVAAAELPQFVEVRRANKAEWTSWLEKSFPDASRYWPGEAKASFEKAAAGSWDLVGKGDYHFDKVPTALLARFGKGDVAVEVKVLKWRGEEWVEALRLGAGAQGVMNGEPVSIGSKKAAGYLLDLSNAVEGERGLWVAVVLADKDGKDLSETRNFHYSNKTKLFALDAY